MYTMMLGMNKLTIKFHLKEKQVIDTYSGIYNTHSLLTKKVLKKSMHYIQQNIVCIYKTCLLLNLL